MSALTPLQAETARFKRSADYAEKLWQKWPLPENWPGVLDLYEAAAYRRVHYKTIRKACTPDRRHRAALRHQRFGVAYRIARADLDRFGLVKNREAA